MKLEELYECIGGNYQEAIGRFLNENMLEMFMKKYFASSCFAELEAALKEHQMKEAFEAAHSLKGLTLSMAFSELSKYCVLLTEDLRAEKCDDTTMGYWEEVKNEYLKIKKLWEG